MRISLFCFFLFVTTLVQSQTVLDTASCIRNSSSILSIVVSVKDSPVYARLFNQTKNDALLNNQSLTKSIEAILIGIAIDKGLIRSSDEPIVDFFPELKNDPDKRKQHVTIKDIMNQASGLWHENLERLDIYLNLKNPSDYTLQQPLVSEPGSILHYNNAASHLLSVVITKAAKESTLDFAQNNLFKPLGIKEAAWPTMKDGYCDGSGLLSVRLQTTDMNKIGRLLLNEGQYRGKQIVSKKWVHSLLAPEKTYPAPWGLTNTQYALCFYHRTYKQEAIIYGMGWGGQFLILIPRLKAVISINQVVDDRTAIQQSNTFMEQIFPLILDWIKTR